MFTSVGAAMTIPPLNGFVPGELAREVSLPITSVHFDPATTFLEWARLTSAFVTVRVQVPSIGSGGGAAFAAATMTNARATTERTSSFTRPRLRRHRPGCPHPGGMNRPASFDDGTDAR